MAAKYVVMKNTEKPDEPELLVDQIEWGLIDDYQNKRSFRGVKNEAPCEGRARVRGSYNEDKGEWDFIKFTMFFGKQVYKKVGESDGQ